MQFTFVAPRSMKKPIDATKPAHLSRSKHLRIMVEEGVKKRLKKLATK